MTQSAEQGKAEQLAAVAAMLRERLPAADAPLATAFAERFYSQVAPEDLAERSVADLYGAALSQLHFARRYAAGAPKLRVYNPRTEEHGWQTTHTVIEIVNDDMPFLVDSITMEVNRQGLTLHLIIHPVMKVCRDADGTLQKLADAAGDSEAACAYESIIHVEVDRRTEAAQLEALQAGLLKILGDVRAAVADWGAMRAQIAEIIADIERTPPPDDPADAAEDRAFLEWIADGNFTFLGYREYQLASENGEDVLRVVAGSGLGILREHGEQRSISFAALPPEVREIAHEPRLLVLTKANARATVHRPGYLDYLGIKRFDASGRTIGERRFLGLFTSTAYDASPRAIPLLRRKIATVIERAGFLPNSHAAKSLYNILEQYPRDELLQIPPDELFTIALGILRLGERQRTRLFVRRDAFCRFFSCLIYVPRENYNTELRERMQAVLMEAFNGRSSEFNVQLSESALARIHIIVHTRPGCTSDYDVADIERRLVLAARRWPDELRQALCERGGEERGNLLYQRYAAAFPAGYREAYAARAAVGDVELMESLSGPEGLAMNLYRPLEAAPGSLRFKALCEGQPMPLSLSLPMLEHMGVRVLEERPYEIRRADGASIWLHDFGLWRADAEELDIDRLRDIFQEAFLAAWRGVAENDDFNRLVLGARLTWRQVTVLRAYAKYMRQAGFTFSQAYIEQTLAAHPDIARRLLDLFLARHDPAAEAGNDADSARLEGEIAAALDQVTSLDEDRILRQFLAVILATVRTNYFQRQNGGHKPYLSFKLDPHRVPGLPEPRPMFEIYVHSPRVEGVHLRGGKVARGGLRWSDRMEDFRTEVLGLMKAQMVKNTVIVPVGSKGGFVVKNPPPGGDRDALLQEGIACYRTYLHGLLDLTDNLVGGRIVPPADVYRRDGDDPYLVVAADKGTASFSDFANAVSREYGFWLGDAFASGGSAGYDHKKMAITARGAWESVKRHFRELGLDTQAQEFTVAGIGDMSGDVFGNGMLLSPHIRLVAAFDHRHIFIDPDPNAAASFAERQRLFDLPRSSWADYEMALISAGGGIWPRSAKSVTLSPQARAVLGIEAETLTPQELVHAVLLAPVDLLYNGGIGTYVKSQRESHADVGDRANDAIRVNGGELRCRVVAEGGNLGCTQLGRIEYALKGGRINTDAIDNSAGVDCSDHEVNIKILLNAVIEDGELTEKQRNALLVEMTDDVARLVLRDNYFQTQVLSIARSRGVHLLDEQARYIRHLSNAGRLNRRLEFLPFEEELAERKAAGCGLTAPELAVLLAYHKMELFEALLASDLPEDGYIATALGRYFPQQLRQRFPAQVGRHPLRREIVATHVVNSMVNRVGPTFVFRLQEETGAAPADIVRAYLATREVFGLVPLWQAIEALDNQVADATQTEMIHEGLRLIQRGTLWFLHHRDHLRDLAATLERFSGGVEALAASLAEVVAPPYRAELDAVVERLVAQGVPAELAQRVACLEELYSALDVIEVAGETGVPAERVARVYFSLGGELDLHWLGRQIGALPADTHWQGMARAALRDDLSAQARNLAAEVLRASLEEADIDALLAAWKTRHAFQYERCRQLFTEIRGSSAPDMPMLSVALRELRTLA
ncbi:MAG: NAD-glutamate dehydrogenase [Rhodocyclales bacterium]|nr:NAD-glutamate dehydrogenase [Rhodocyclales bacterium]